MSISNFADWFVPTTTANEAAAEPETRDQAPQDFATLLAASYTDHSSSPRQPSCRQPLPNW